MQEEICNLTDANGNSLLVTTFVGFDIPDGFFPIPSTPHGRIIDGHTLVPIMVVLDYFGNTGPINNITATVEVRTTGERFNIYDQSDFPNTEVVSPDSIAYTSSVLNYPAALDEGCLSASSAADTLVLYGIPDEINDVINDIIRFRFTITFDGQTCATTTSQPLIFTPLGTQLANIVLPTNSTDNISLSDTGAIQDCSPPSISSVFPCSTVPNTIPRNILIDRKLIVDTNYTFRGEGTITMTDIKSGIIVESGYTLTLDGFLWIEGCLDAWESILVKDGGTLIIRGNVHISGARQAIIVEDGGTLIIRGNAFIFDNWDGIVANSSSLNGANPNIFIDGAVFAHAYFLLEPRFGEKANRGIKLDKVTAGVTITGEENGGNLFYDLKTGIDLTQSSISVSDSEFSNFWSVLPRGTGVNLQHSKIGIKMNEAPVFSFLPFTATMGPTAQGTSGNTFKSLDIGVLAQSRSNAVIMRRNALDFVANGVYLINGAAATISNNRITSRHHGIYSVGTTPYLSQIITDNTFEATFDCNFPSASFTFGMGFIDLGSAPLFQSRFIRNNKIDMLGARYGLLGANMVNCSIFDNDIKWLEEENGIESPYPYESLGLYLINTGLASINNNLVEGLDLPNFELADGMRFENMLAPNISCNTVDYVGNGIHFIGMNNNSFFAANDIYNAETGLRLGEGDVEAIIGQQGNATKQNANEWLGSYGNIGALNNSSDLFTLESSLFTLSTENDLDYLPSNNQNANVWFADLEPQLVDPVGCPPNQPPEPSGLIESDPYLNALMNGGDIFNSAWTAAEWMGHTRLKELDETGRIDPSQFSNYSKWANSPIQVDLDKHWDYLDKINELYTFDSLDMYHYELFNENIGALTLEMDTLHTLLDTNSVDFDSTLIADRAELITDLNNLYTANATLIADMQSEIVFDMSKLTTAASNLPQTTQVQKDYKTMQGYYLDLLQSDSSNILTDSVIIIDLADACPLMKGEGVYTARALLAAVGIDRTYDDNANCQLPPSRPGLTNIGEENFAVSIAPNPFRGEDLTVRYPAGEYQNIELVNTLGQSFGQQVITEGQSMTVFGSEIFDQLPSGILFVRLSGEDVEPVTSQVILR